MSELIVFPVSEIIRDSRAQPRLKIDKELVAEYAAAMMEETAFPPVVVFKDPKTSKVFLADGWHRHMAAEQAGSEAILVESHPPVSGETAIRSAIMYSTGANARHGLRRTVADKRRAVLTLLQDEKWGIYSDRKIAKKAEVGHSFVAKVRKEYLESIPDAIQRSVVKFERGGKVHEQKRNKTNAKVRHKARVEIDARQQPNTTNPVSCALTDIGNAFAHLPSDPLKAVEIAISEGCWLEVKDAALYSQWLIRYAVALQQIKSSQSAGPTRSDKEQCGAANFTEGY